MEVPCSLENDLRSPGILLDIHDWSVATKVLIPKEHGAWAILYGPFILTITLFGRFEFRVLVFFVAITALFLAHEPISKLVRTYGHGVARSQLLYWKRWLLVYLVAALVCGFYLFWNYSLWLLVPLGLLIAFLMCLHLYLVGRRRERSVWGELLGVVGLTSTAPASCYVISGTWEYPCLLLWLLSFLYFASGVFYVKMRVSRHIKTGEHLQHVRHCVAYHSFLLIALLLLSWYGLISKILILAYLPIIVRALAGAFAREERLNIRRIGFNELGQSLVFIVLFVVFWNY